MTKLFINNMWYDGNIYSLYIGIDDHNMGFRVHSIGEPSIGSLSYGYRGNIFL